MIAHVEPNHWSYLEVILLNTPVTKLYFLSQKKLRNMKQYLKVDNWQYFFIVLTKIGASFLFSF